MGAKTKVPLETGRGEEGVTADAQAGQAVPEPERDPEAGQDGDPPSQDGAAASKEKSWGVWPFKW
eukprot:1619579-Rhodomonas_salina.2